MSNLPSTVQAVASTRSLRPVAGFVSQPSASGVAVAFNPPKWLKPGDKVEIEIESVGRLVGSGDGTLVGTALGTKEK